MSLWPLLFLTIAAVCLGCGACSKKGAPQGTVAQPAAREPGGAPAEKTAGQAGADKALPRRIIYTASMSVIAEDFSKAVQELLRLVKEQKGYIMNSEVTGSPGATRSAHWKIRLP